MNKTFQNAKLAVLVCVFAMSVRQSTTNATFLPMLVSASGDTYVYNLSFVSNGSELLTSGAIITLYDIALPGTVSHASLQLPGDTISLQPLGTTPPSLLGAAGLVDDPSLINLTFTYRGSFLTTNALVNTLTVTVPGAGDAVRHGLFASTNQINSDGTIFAQLGSLSLPALVVPEPSALGLTGLLLAIAARRRRKITVPAPVSVPR